jgi:hypothetical protein
MSETPLIIVATGAAIAIVLFMSICAAGVAIQVAYLPSGKFREIVVEATHTTRETIPAKREHKSRLPNPANRRAP